MSGGHTEWDWEGRIDPSWGLAPRGVELALWGVLLAVAVLDIATTYHGLSVGLEEGNPVARLLLEAHGLVGLVGLKLLVLAVAVAFRRLLDQPYRWVIPLAALLPWTTATAINVALIVGVA
jgi:uncharacterized membrane protein YhaH (DUF805 family)